MFLRNNLNFDLIKEGQKITIILEDLSIDVKILACNGLEILAESKDGLFLMVIPIVCLN